MAPVVSRKGAAVDEGSVVWVHSRVQGVAPEVSCVWVVRKWSGRIVSDVESGMASIHRNSDGRVVGDTEQVSWVLFPHRMDKRWDFGHLKRPGWTK